MTNKSTDSDARKDEATDKKPGQDDDSRDWTLSPEDASAGGPAGESVGGEEDPGAGLEFLVKKRRP